MTEHPKDGQLNSTASHGTQAPCATCDGNPTGLFGVPEECQWAMLQPMLDQRLRAGKARFAAYRQWHQLVGVFGIRVKPPNCVLEGVARMFGESETGFVAGDNQCPCMKG